MIEDAANTLDRMLGILTVPSARKCSICPARGLETHSRDTPHTLPSKRRLTTVNKHFVLGRTCMTHFSSSGINKMCNVSRTIVYKLEADVCSRYWPKA